jgi:two-component sensor histidine kinase
MKIVMVDDSGADRRLYRLLLEEVYGPKLEFYEAASAADGLKTCLTVSPDCVLLDYKLPDLTGLEFLAKVPKQTGDVPAFGVVMLTGLSSEQVAVEAMKSGAQDYLVKDSITPEALSLAVEKATEKVGLIRTLREERDRLARMVSEKEVLVKEVHHRVKNNLQVIASLLRLQASSSADQTPVEALRESQNRVEAMALIHEQLYESADLREVDLAKHAALLMSNLFQSYGVDPARIAGTAEIAPLPDGRPLVLGVDQAIPAGLILNELVSNALKHAFPEGRGGSIRIEGRSCGGRIHLAVADDGVGVPENFETRQAKSLGLQIVNILTRQLKGTFEVERGNGTAFRVSFPERQV